MRDPTCIIRGRELTPTLSEASPYPLHDDRHLHRPPVLPQWNSITAILDPQVQATIAPRPHLSIGRHRQPQRPPLLRNPRRPPPLLVRMEAVPAAARSKVPVYLEPSDKGLAFSIQYDSIECQLRPSRQDLVDYFRGTKPLFQEVFGSPEAQPPPHDGRRRNSGLQPLPRTHGHHARGRNIHREMTRRPHRVPPSSFTGPSAPQTDPTKTEMQQASSQLSSNPRQASGQYEPDNAASPLSMELPKDVYHVGDTQQGASSVGRRGSNGGAILFAADEYQPRLIGPCRGDKQTIVFERRKAPKA